MTKCIYPRKKNKGRKHERKLRANHTLLMKSLRREIQAKQKFDLNGAQICMEEMPANDIFAAQTQIRKLQHFLQLACQEIIHRDSKLTPKNNTKKVNRTRKIKQCYHDEKVKRELHNLTNKLNKICETNKDSYKNLIREIKHLIKEEKNDLLEIKNDNNHEEIFTTTCTGTKNWNISTSSVFSSSSKLPSKITFNEQKFRLNVEFDTYQKQTDTSCSDEENDVVGENASSCDLDAKPSTPRVPQSFLRELESQLFHSSTKIRKQPKRKRRKIKQNKRFHKIKNQLDKIITQRVDDFVKVDPEILDHEEFDFCDISNDLDSNPVSCRPSGVPHEKFNLAMNIIKQKKYKLKKTARYVEDIEGVQVKTESAYRSAMSKIFQRRKYFDIEDESEDMDIDI